MDTMIFMNASKYGCEKQIPYFKKLIGQGLGYPVELKVKRVSPFVWIFTSDCADKKSPIVLTKICIVLKRINPFYDCII